MELEATDQDFYQKFATGSVSIPWQNEVGTCPADGVGSRGAPLGSVLIATCSVADGGDRVLPGAECLRAGWLGSPRPGLEGPAACTPKEGTAAEALQSPGNPQQCPTWVPHLAPGDGGWEAEPVPACAGSRHPPAVSAVPRVSGLIPACPPPPAGLTASFLFPEVSSVGSPWVGLAARPWGATDSPSMAEARCGRKKSGARSLPPPAHCFCAQHLQAASLA